MIKYICRKSFYDKSFRERRIRGNVSYMEKFIINIILSGEVYEVILLKL